MAKVTAPLLSFGASGQIGKSMVFADWRGIDYARRYVVPANPNSTAQQLTRNTFATLREMWKLAPTLLRDPWTAFATGRKFINLNAFVGENMRVVRGEANFLFFVGSPGARGGIPPTSISAAAGVGTITVTFVNPAPPPGWAISAAQCVAFPDQAPDVDFIGPFASAEDAAAPQDTVIIDGGLDTVLHIVSGWLEWTKPNGDLAYSVGLIDSATPT